VEEGPTNCSSRTSRGYLYFDTSGLSGATVTSVDLKIYVVDAYNFVGVTYSWNGLQVLRDPDNVFPSESSGSPALALGDFDKTEYTQIATVAASVMDDYHTGGSTGQVRAWIPISLPVSAVNTEGLTKLCIMMYDYAELTYHAQTVSFHSADGANVPYLDIDYAPPPVFPKVNKGDVWVDPEEIVVNKGDEWIPYEDLDVNLGDSWVEPV